MTTKKGLRIILHMLPYTLEQKEARITDERQRREFEREKIIHDIFCYSLQQNLDWKCGVSSPTEAELRRRRMHEKAVRTLMDSTPFYDMINKKR